MRKVIRNSLKYLEEQISPESIEKKCKTPMIELQLDLYAEKPMFVPDIQHEYKPPTSEVSFVEIVTSENQSDLISITFVLSNGKSFPLSLSNNEVEQDTKKDEKKKTESYVFELKRNEYVTSVMGAFDEHKKVFDFIELVTSTGRRQRYSMSTSKDAETFELKSPPGHMIQSITRFKNNRGSISASFGVVAGNLLLNTVEIPDSSNSDKKTGIRDTIELWIGRFFDVAKMFPRLDFHSKKSDYIADVFDKSLEDIIEQIRSHAQVWSNKCEEYRTKYKTYEALWTTDLQEMIRSFVSKAVQKTPLGQNMPDLEKFEEALRTYKEKQSEIDCMPTPKDIGWLRISAMPIKQALCTYTNKWIFAFTSYLSDYVMNQVNSFHEFVELTKKGLSENVPEDDPESLMRVMSVISRVRIRMGTTRELFEPLNSTVKLLRDVGIDMDIKVGGDMVVVDYLDVASTLWDSLVNDTFVKKEKILPLQNTEADKVKAKIASFNTELEAFYKSFRASNLFTYSGESEKAFKDIEEKKAQLDTINVKAERLARLEELFELPITKRSKTEVVSKDLSLLRKLWTFKRDMTVTINKWKTIQWKDIDTDDLEDRVSEFSKEIRKIGQIDVVVKGWQVFKDIQARCKNLSEVIPLINELHTPAMRERHWKALAIETNTTSIPYKEPSFCLKNLLDLNLHLCVEDVEDILDTAKKEFKIETKLSTIEAMWTGTFFLSPSSQFYIRFTY
jgi:dynein heavy chain, axonemal